MIRDMPVVPDMGRTLDSPAPLTVVTADKDDLLAALRDAAGARGIPIWTWSASAGLARDGDTAEFGTHGLAGALAQIVEIAGPAVFVLCAASGPLSNPLTLRRLDDALQRLEPGQMVVVPRPDGDVPVALAALARGAASDRV